MFEIILASLVFVSSVAPSDIAWQKSWDDTLAQAKSQKKIVFVAVNMDGEHANDRLATSVYKDKSVVELSAQTLSVVASVVEHTSGDKPCPRFAGITCADHRRIDVTLRKDVLKPDAEGWVVAPQHVFLDPSGKVILSVPYEISASELAWCFVTALHTFDASSNVAMPSGAHAPRRLILGGVYDPNSAPGGGQRTPTRAEVLEKIKSLRKEARGKWEKSDLREILASDEPEALEFIRAELRSGGAGGGGGKGGGAGAGGGKGGGGGGGSYGGAANANGDEAQHAEMLHLMGIVSPAAYWAIAAEYTGDNEVKVRDEALVALEQMASPDSIKALETALAKETDKKVQKDVLRALASAGANDKSVRQMLLKRAKSEKDALLRVNLIAALGSLAAGDDLAQTLDGVMKDGKVDERSAAALAMAINRDARYQKSLELAAKDTRDAAAAKTAELALAVAKGASIGTLAAPLKKLCQDTIDRERFFGAPRE